jgi:ABC-type transporter Mla MlaB component
MRLGYTSSRSIECQAMVFFSSKPKGPSRPKATSPALAPTPRPMAADIQVDEIGQPMPPWMEDAVILYATGKTGEAATVLNRHLLEHPEERDIVPWLMLFDLHEAHGRREHFEDLALDFAVKFERSPPVWAPMTDRAEAARAKVARFDFGVDFSAVDKARLQHFLLEAETAAIIRLDFSRTPTPARPHALTILDCIHRLRKLDKAIELIGGPAFIVRLHAACLADRCDEQGWLLLLAMQELMGDARAFEDTALGYAVRFEISPPSYVAPKTLGDSNPDQAPDDTPADALTLDGDVGLKAAEQFKAIEAKAAGRERVDIDMRRAARIDFASSGQVLDSLMRLSASGRPVTLIGCNQLVHGLLRMIGADQYATLVARKRT